MPAPSYSWTTVANARIDALSPGDTALIEDLRDNLEFLRELVLGTNTTIASVPHVHLGATDAALGTTTSDNLLQNSAPDDDGDDNWTVSDISTANNIGFEVSTTEGAYAFQILTTRAVLSKAMVGTTGGDFVVSLFVKAKTSAPTTGILSFGLANGSTSSFLSGCKAEIPAASITTSWKRFFLRVQAKGGGASTDVRFLLVNGAGGDAALDQIVYVTSISVCLGRSLTYWLPGICEALGNGDPHDDWRRYGLTSAPTWEETTAMTNATEITGT